ncbi:MAG: FHA domain-containing protein [Phycisphaerales bacterium]|nr:FHA domain-containing protein [Phycisphaerales bacterium]
MATLYVLRGPDKGLIFDLPDDATLIGRYADRLKLTDDSISRRHAEVRRENGGWFIRDLHSSNGTYHNGHRVFEPTRLQHGDEIKVGATILVFGGQDSVAAVSGPHRIRDLVDIDIASQPGDAAILSSIASSEESVILQTPETREQVVAWHVVYRIAEVIGTIPRIENFLERVADILFDHLVVDRMVVLSLHRATGELTPELVRYRTKRKGKRPKIHTSRTIINYVIESGAGVLCANAMTDRRFTGMSKQDSIHQLALRSVLCVPIVLQEEVVGVMHLDTSMSQHAYTQEQLRLVTAVGRMIGLAMENARLIESRMKNERLAATGETVARLSHEIRNILQGLRSGADVVEMGLKQDKLDLIRSGWKIVKRGMERAVVLATNMLSYSKQREPRIQLVQLAAVVEDAVRLMRDRAAEKSVMILKELEEMAPVPADAYGLQQAIGNILMNAVDAVQPGMGCVTIRTRYDAEHEEARISITDNGPGITTDELSHIFEPFVSTKGQAGTGLGLAVARKVVEEHQGRIQVESVPHEGATFHVILPTHREGLPDSEKTHGAAR